MPDSPAVVVVSKPCVIVVEARAAPVPVMAYGPQGPAGRPGVGGADISREPNNRLVAKPDGLFVDGDLTPDPLAYYILAKG